MIKNQLYPYIEKYFNEYLWGFTKEQFNVGVMNGTILLEKINLRSDKVNEKLDSQDIPLWLKAGVVRMIKVTCSLMNFIGEKPLDIIIEDVNLVLTCSSKWILQNKSSYIEENENHIRDIYDPTDNNSHDVFSKKINIYDGSILKEKQKLIEVFTDKAKLTELINKLFTKALRFYYQKVFLINFTIKNVHIRFEDDLFNYFGNTAFGVKIGKIEGSLSADGVIKKNSIKAEKINIYWEPNPSMLIPSKVYVDNLDLKTNTINEKYYDYLKTIKFNNISKNHYLLLKDLNVICNFGQQLMETANVDFFSGAKQKNLKFFLQVATSDVNMNIYPEMPKKIKSLVEILRSNYLVENVQDYKPMRKPYNPTDTLVINNKYDPIVKAKRKLVARDWLYYLVWFNRFKRAVYGKIHHNALNEEFSKYYNICCLAGEEEKDEQDNSLIFKKEDKSKKPEIGDLNPENINLTVLAEILIKSANISMFTDTEKDEYIVIKLNNISNKCFIQKDKFELSLDFKEFSINNKSNITISKSLLDSDTVSQASAEVNHDSFSGFDTFSGMNGTANGSTNASSNINKHNTTSYVNKKVNILHQTLDKLAGGPPTSRLTKVGTKTDNKSLTNIFFDDNVSTTVTTKKTNHIDLSKEINDYNKRNTVFVKNEVGKPVNPYKDALKNNTNEQVTLNIVDIIQSNNTCFNFKFNKAASNNRISESVNINMGLIRINLTEEQVNKTLLIFSEYVKLNTLDRLKDNFKLNALGFESSIYYLRKHLHAKLNDLIKKKLGNSNVESFRNYLARELQNYDSKLLEGGKFEVNYLFNILSKSNFQVLFNYADFQINSFSHGHNNIQPIGKVKFPKINLFLNLNKDKINFRCFDFDYEYYDLEQWRSILNNSIKLVGSKFKFTNTVLEPVVKYILEERNYEKRDFESNATEPVKMQMSDKIASSKNNLNLKNIIDNNMATGKAFFYQTRSDHSSQVDMGSDNSYIKQKKSHKDNKYVGEESVFEVEKELSHFNDDNDSSAGNRKIHSSKRNNYHVRIPTYPNNN
jgi:hypothetical protein